MKNNEKIPQTSNKILADKQMPKTSNPKSKRSSLIRQGIDFENSGNNEEALRCFNEELLQDHKVGDIYPALATFFKACILEKIGNLDEMSECHLQLSRMNLKAEETVFLIDLYVEVFKEKVPKKSSEMLDRMVETSIADLKKQLKTHNATHRKLSRYSLISDIEMLKIEFAEMIIDAKHNYLTITRDKPENKHKEAILEAFTDENKRITFYKLYNKLSNCYEALMPNESVAPYLEDYKQLTRMYQTLKKSENKRRQQGSGHPSK